MPKMKTHCGTKKRFKLTATGLVKRGRPGTSHLAPGKTQKRVRHLRKAGTVCAADLKRIRQQLANIK
ncbi:MAG: 50S ribosomal protein L35 [Bacilli bacterium]|jgi:large subunit ribosomal protein L35|nr:50S ribosomal protein L35 [Bacilli bacterium]